MSVQESEAKESPEELRSRILKVAMQDKEHLKRWLRESGRSWMVLSALDLVDALVWPGGVQDLMGMIQSYRGYRATIPSGKTEIQVVPITGQKVEVALMKGEVLEVDEMKLVVDQLLHDIREKEPTWSP